MEFKGFDREGAREVMKEYSPDKSTFNKVWQHCVSVRDVAVDICKDIVDEGHAVDMDLVGMACLVHDIGRFDFPPDSSEEYKHAYRGSKILEDEGWPEEVVRAVSRHIGSGITAEEISKNDLDLPEKDFVPETMEEKIVCYADNIVFKDRIASVDQVVRKFRKDIPSSTALERFKRIHNEIEKFRGSHHTI